MGIIRLKASDFDEALDFLNLVFSRAYAPTCFEKMLPLIYRPTDEHMRCNFAVRENGRIRAIVGLFPAQVQAGDTVLALGGIGGVSSHPNDRGKGWMRQLMNRCIEEMQHTTVDLSFLTGLRQRYQYFGYEKAGSLVEHTVSKTNLSHSLEQSETATVRFAPLVATDIEYISKAKALYDRQPVRCIRPASDFYLYLLSMNAEPWVALSPAGGMVGYLVHDPNQSRITEIFAESDAAFAGMIRCWVAQQNTAESSVILSLWQGNHTRYLGGLAEESRLTDNGNWRIFNWEKVINALLVIKQTDRFLRDGSLSIGIKEYGTIHICIRNGQIECAKTALPPDFEWEPSIAARVLFGPCAGCRKTMYKAII